MAELTRTRRRPPSAFAEQITDLAQRPIVIRSSRARAVLLLVSCFGFMVFGLAAVLKGEEDLVAAALPAALIFGLGMAVAGLQLVKPSILTITSEGVAVRTLLRNWSVRWDQVQEFFVYDPRPAGPTAVFVPGMAAFRWSDPPLTGRRWLGGDRRRALDGSFGGGWQLSARALTELLNAARDAALAELAAD